MPNSVTGEESEVVESFEKLDAGHAFEALDDTGLTLPESPGPIRNLRLAPTQTYSILHELCPEFECDIDSLPVFLSSHIKFIDLPSGQRFAFVPPGFIDNAFRKKKISSNAEISAYIKDAIKAAGQLQEEDFKNIAVGGVIGGLGRWERLKGLIGGLIGIAPTPNHAHLIFKLPKEEHTLCHDPRTGMLEAFFKSNPKLQNTMDDQVCVFTSIILFFYCYNALKAQDEKTLLANTSQMITDIQEDSELIALMQDLQGKIGTSSESLETIIEQFIDFLKKPRTPIKTVVEVADDDEDEDEASPAEQSQAPIIEEPAEIPNLTDHSNLEEQPSTSSLEISDEITPASITKPTELNLHAMATTDSKAEVSSAVSPTSTCTVQEGEIAEVFSDTNQNPPSRLVSAELIQDICLTPKSELEEFPMGSPPLTKAIQIAEPQKVLSDVEEAFAISPTPTPDVSSETHEESLSILTPGEQPAGALEVIEADAAPVEKPLATSSDMNEKPIPILTSDELGADASGAAEPAAIGAFAISPGPTPAVEESFDAPIDIAKNPDPIMTFAETSAEVPTTEPDIGESSLETPPSPLKEIEQQTNPLTVSSFTPHPIAERPAAASELAPIEPGLEVAVTTQKQKESYELQFRALLQAINAETARLRKKENSNNNYQILADASLNLSANLLKAKVDFFNSAFSKKDLAKFNSSCREAFIEAEEYFADRQSPNSSLGKLINQLLNFILSIGKKDNYNPRFFMQSTSFKKFGQFKNESNDLIHEMQHPRHP